MSDSLKPWFSIATPHSDIREGKLEEAVFAANIWAVVQKTAPEVYRDPEEFFRKTYMTVGLGAVLSRVGAALSGGEAGDRIISLQTAFGGGKTHTLVALWHLAKHAKTLKASKHCADLRRVLGDKYPENVRGVAVFTNATCDATQGRQTPEGVHTHTLWGELALQLGGPKLYEMVRANDETQRVPQGLFVEVLKAAAPCLILLDEMADYCVGAAAVRVGDTTLADQTISFIQQLTEAVQQVPGAVVVATLPASKIEVAQSEKGQEAFVTLEKRFQRLGADVKPVADDEIYAVVRARLFESITTPKTKDYPRAVAESYQEMYAAHAGEVPTEVSKASYRDQIEKSYPFHPLLIDAIYMRWGSHPDFQRTRGVLRLLASVVGDLWQRRDTNTQSQPLIQPCHLKWSIDAVQAALTRLWGNGYQAVAAADVLGNKANSVLFDDERGGDYAREKIGQGLAAAILLGSFGGQGQKSGFSAKDLKLACSRPGLNWNYVDGALLELENRCFYLHFTSAGSLGKRYWFGTKPTLNKLVVQYRQNTQGQDFDSEVLDALKKHANSPVLGGATWRVLVNPEADLPEQKSLTLLVFSPTLAWADDEASKETVRKRVRELSGKCGGKDRMFRNTLLFLAPTARGLNKLRSAYRERAALRGVQTDYLAQLDEEQRIDLKGRLDAAEQSAAQALGPAYTTVLRVSGSDVEVAALTDARTAFTDHLAYVWEQLVGDDHEWILRRVGSVTLDKVGLVPKERGHRLRDAIEAFLRFTDKPMIATKDAVTAGVAQACRDGVVGIGRGASLAALQASYCRESVTLDPTEEGLWIIPAFERAMPSTTSVPPTGGGSTGPAPTGGSGSAPTPATGGGGKGGGATAPRIRLIGVKGAVPAENWPDIFKAFVGPAARSTKVKLRIGIDISVHAAEGLEASDPMVQTMREAARQLGLDIEVEDLGSA
jgi:hypothetical protein